MFLLQYEDKKSPLVGDFFCFQQDYRVEIKVVVEIRRLNTIFIEKKLFFYFCCKRLKQGFAATVLNPCGFQSLSCFDNSFYFLYF